MKERELRLILFWFILTWILITIFTVCGCEDEPKLDSQLFIFFDKNDLPVILDRDNVTYIGIPKDQLDIVHKHEEDILRGIIVKSLEKSMKQRIEP